MSNKIITSSANTSYKEFLKLHETKYRKKTGSFLVEGMHLVLEAQKNNALRMLILKEGEEAPFDFATIYTLSESLFDKLSATVSSGCIMAVCEFKEEEVKDAQRVLVCERIQDPGNMGTLIRSACAFGFDQIICTPDCVDVTNEKVIRSTQGSLFQIPIQILDINTCIHQLNKENFHIYGTGFNQSIHLSDVVIKNKIALVLGNEGQGLSKQALCLCNEIITIEMQDFDSLNVSVAGGILMYHFRKP